jgi:hypothetical protein
MLLRKAATKQHVQRVLERLTAWTISFLICTCTGSHKRETFSLSLLLSGRWFAIERYNTLYETSLDIKSTRTQTSFLTGFSYRWGWTDDALDWSEAMKQIPLVFYVGVALWRGV